MIDSGIVLLFTGLSGIAVFFAGIVMGNAVLFRMQKALNDQAEPEDKVSPWKVMGRYGGRYNTVERYKTKFGDCSLVHQDRVYARLILGGGVLAGISLLMLRLRN